uniref:Metalloendopeptidase n=1 Tax=Parastrongyloides trichosuri TaxID=131310 RepID=A0A0N4ZM55_PARTI
MVLSIIFLVVLLPTLTFHYVSFRWIVVYVVLQNLDGDNLERSARGILKKQTAKWKFPLKYSIKDNLDKHIIRKAFDNIEKETCLRFNQIKTNLPDGQGIIFVKDPSCYVHKGNIHGNEHHYLYLNDQCSKSVSQVQFYVGMLLGLVGHHRRYDRDNYVTVNYSNVIPSKTFEFTKYNISDIELFGVGYDYVSLQNLDEYAYNVNGKATISPKHPFYSLLMRYRQEMTFTDYKLLNYYYCKHQMSSPKKNKCKNGGYSLDKRSKKCKCPNMFAGNHCERLEKSSYGCGKLTLIAQGSLKKIYFRGNKKCLHRIRPLKRNKNVEVVAYEMKTTVKVPCNENLNLEIKYQDDKGVMGIGGCGRQGSYSFKGIKGKNMVIKYQGMAPKDYAVVYYKAV